jgi:hypothetical protein
VTTGERARGVKERYLPRVQLFAQGVLTNLGILQETGHDEPWIIAMDCLPTRAAVRRARGGRLNRPFLTLRAGALTWRPRTLSIQTAWNG